MIKTRANPLWELNSDRHIDNGNLNASIPEILTILRALLKLPRCSIYLNQDNDLFDYKHFSSMQSSNEAEAISHFFLDDSYKPLIQMVNQTVIGIDSRDTLNDLHSSYFIKNNIESMIAAPIFLYSRFVGVLFCEQQDSERMWTEQDIQCVSQASTMIGRLILAYHCNTTLEKQNLSNQELLRINEHLLDQLKESEKLANLGRLVAGIAHEVNNPLGIAITGYSALEGEIQAIKKCFNDQELTEQRFNDFLEIVDESLSLVSRNLQRAASLVRDFKQTASDQVSDECYRFNLAENIQSLVNSLHAMTKKVPVEVVIEIDDQLMINSYPGAYNQIFSNFIMNSIHHGFSDMAIPAEISISVVEHDEQLTLTYKDNGSGVPQTIQKRIFEEYFTTRRGMGGTGLGLAIVQELVNIRLGGVIELDESHKPGTCFIIRVPLNSPDLITD